MTPATCLQKLEGIKTVFDEETAVERLKLLNIIQGKRLATSKQVQRLHDILCFICAYPDNTQIFSLADSILCHFADRNDLKQQRKALTNSGIAGTNFDYRFYWPMAQWLADNWPQNLRLLWRDIDTKQNQQLLKLLPLLMPFWESTAFDEFDRKPKQWLHRLKGAQETDAYFYIKRLSATFNNDFEREAIHDDLDLYYHFKATAVSPNLSTTRYPASNIVYQDKSLAHSKPGLARVLQKSEFTARHLTQQEGKQLVDLARKTMLTHSRDLDVFAYGNPADVTLMDFMDGYQIACIGMLPDRRYLIHATYGFLTLKNGIPVGYFPLSSAFNTADVAFNLFTAFRGGEAALVYSYNLAVAHQYFGVNTFIVDPYQLGHNNQEGLKSGVWWFYYKLGFRPADKQIRKLLRQELASIKQVAGYRTPLIILNQLASANMYFSIKGSTEDYDTLAALSTVIPAVSSYLSRRFGSRRETGIRTCALDAAKTTGLQIKQLNKQELQAWQLWAPLLMCLDKIEDWSDTDRKRLIQLIRMKGHQSETGYLSMLNSNKRIKSALLRYATRQN